MYACVYLAIVVCDRDKVSVFDPGPMRCSSRLCLGLLVVIVTAKMSCIDPFVARASGFVTTRKSTTRHAHVLCVFPTTYEVRIRMLPISSTASGSRSQSYPATPETIQHTYSSTSSITSKYPEQPQPPNPAKNAVVSPSSSLCLVTSPPDRGLAAASDWPLPQWPPSSIRLVPRRHRLRGRPSKRAYSYLCFDSFLFPLTSLHVTS